MGLFGNKRDKSVVKAEKSEYHSSGKTGRSSGGGGGIPPPPSSSGVPISYFDPYGQMLNQQQKFPVVYPSMNKSVFGLGSNPFDPQQQQQQQGSMFIPPTQASLQAQANAIFQMQQYQGGGSNAFSPMQYPGQQQQGVMPFQAQSSPYFDANQMFAQQQQAMPMASQAFAPYQGMNFSDPSTAAAMGGAFAGPYGYFPSGY